MKHRSESSRKHQILLAADLVLLESGIDGFTIDQVISKAGIAKGTVYKYFKNKDELLRELSVKAISILLQMFKSDLFDIEGSLAKIRQMCFTSHKFHSMYYEYFHLVSYIERPEFDIEIKDYAEVSLSIQNMLDKIVADGQTNGEINPDLNPKHVNYLIWACTIGVVDFAESKKKLIKDLSKEDEKNFINTFATIFTNGLLPVQNQ